MRTLSAGYGFPEGPSQGPDGRVYMVEMSAAAISCFGADGRKGKIADIEGTPAATAWGPDGAMYVTNNGGLAFDENGRPIGKGEPNTGGSIDRVWPDGTVERLYLECDGVPLDAPNDLVFDDAGTFYFTDPEHGSVFTDAPLPKGHVYWATTDGSEIRKVATGYDISNGIGITNDGKTLLVAETLTCKMWAHDILAPGELGPRRLFGELPEKHLPDGFAVDSADHVVVAAVGAGALIHFGPDGEMLERIPTECADPTNCCFIDPDRSVLATTEGTLGRVVGMDWPRPGMVPFPERAF